MSFYCAKYTVVEKKALARDTYSITVHAPDIAKAARAGQFANIAADGFSLRRPISICQIDKQKGTVRFVMEVRGKGTKEISRVNEGEQIDLLAPLGNGFDAPYSPNKLEGKRVAVVGGGIGVPPLLGVADMAKKNCTAIIGFRSSDRIILKEDFERAGAGVYLCTDDGSAGFHGLVTVPLENVLKNKQTDIVCACGPLPMLRAVAGLCEKYDMPCRVSMEQRMGCGVGACVVCSCLTVRNGIETYSRVCRDGPVFDAREVKFDG